MVATPLDVNLTILCFAGNILKYDQMTRHFTKGGGSNYYMS